MAYHTFNEPMTVTEASNTYVYMKPDGVFCEGERMPTKYHDFLIVDYAEVSHGIVYYYTHRKHPKRLTELLADLSTYSPRSAWQKGVKAYAEELLESLAEAIEGGYFDPDNIDAPRMLHKALLNGAPNWSEYSYGGCSLIYDGDIAERLCTPTELKRTDYGRRDPNKTERWLDTQTRALRQASDLIHGIAEATARKEAKR